MRASRMATIPAGHATHLGLHVGERRRQIRQLLKIIRKTVAIPPCCWATSMSGLWGRPLRWMHRLQAHAGARDLPAGRPIRTGPHWVEPRSACSARVASPTARLASDHHPRRGQFRFQGR
jgi:hypothetical protein